MGQGIYGGFSADEAYHRRIIGNGGKAISTDIIPKSFTPHASFRIEKIQKSHTASVAK